MRRRKRRRLEMQTIIMSERRSVRGIILKSFSHAPKTLTFEASRWILERLRRLYSFAIDMDGIATRFAMRNIQ